MGVKLKVSGNSGSYHFGGYKFVIANDSSSKEQVEAKLLLFENFVTSNTIAYNFIMSGYILDSDYFYSLHLLIERTPTGGFQPTIIEYQIFRPSLSWNYPFNLVGDIIIYILTFAQVSVNVRAVGPFHLAYPQVEKKQRKI